MDDLISRQTAIEAIVNTPSEVQNPEIPLINQYDGATFRQIEILGILEGLSSAEPERKKGKWVRNEPNPEDMKKFHKLGFGKAMGVNSIYFTCSECGMWGNVNYHFCPHCGADMR